MAFRNLLLNSLVCMFISTLCKEVEFTSPEFIRGLYQLMKNTHEVLQKHEIPYWAFAGTLLGAVRHGGIIPWDDDLDIVIHDYSEEDFLKIIPEFEALGYYIVTYPWGYKVVDSQSVPGRCLCIDIPFHIKTEQDTYCYPPSCGMDPEKYFFKCSEVYPLKKYKFGGIEIMGPNDPIPYLDRVYPTWRTEAVIYNHVSNEQLVMPLTENLLKPAVYARKLEDQVKSHKHKIGTSSPEQIIIREAHENDADVISQLLGQLGFPQESYVMSLEKIKLFKQSDVDKLWVAKSNDKIIGILALNVITPFYYPGRFARVDTIVVDKQYRNCGIGKLLMRHAEEYAMSLGCQRLFLTSGNHRPEAHAFYKRIGYVNNATYFVKYLKDFKRLKEFEF